MQDNIIVKIMQDTKITRKDIITWAIAIIAIIASILTTYILTRYTWKIERYLGGI